MKLIDKTAVVAEIERRIKTNKECMLGLRNLDYYQGKVDALNDTISFLDTLEVKTDEENYLEKFKSLQHISGDLHQTLEDWGYAPNLYYFDGNWCVDWISCEEGDSIKGFTGDTAEEAIDKACNWFHSTFCNS